MSSTLDYCSSLFTCLNQEFHSSTGRPFNLFLQSLHWLPVNHPINFKILVLTFRAICGQNPSYTVDLIQPYNPSHSLRSSDKKLLMVARTRFRSQGLEQSHSETNSLYVHWTLLILSKTRLRHYYSFNHFSKTKGCYGQLSH